MEIKNTFSCITVVNNKQFNIFTSMIIMNITCLLIRWQPDACYKQIKPINKDFIDSVLKKEGVPFA